MIELVYDDRCISCGSCAKVCPNDVFDFKLRAPPVIARQADCVTCFICEAFCPVDALYVHPISEPTPGLDPHKILESGQVGSYRRMLGWDEHEPGQSNVEPPDYGDPIIPMPWQVELEKKNG